MGRSPCCSKEGLNRGAWTAMEDKILTSYVKAHGEGQWRNLPKRADMASNDVGRVSWDPELVKIFIDLCLEKVNNTGKKGSTLKKESWDNIAKKIQEKKGIKINQKQLRNEWDYLKKKYVIWSGIISKTGNGYNPVTNTVNWSAEQWVEYIKAVPEAKQFRYAGLQWSHELMALFDGITASGKDGWGPSKEGLPVDVIGSSSMQVGVGLSKSHVEFDAQSTSIGTSPDDVQLPNAKRRKKNMSVNLEAELLAVMNTLKYDEGPSIDECNKVLNEMQCLNDNDPLYIVASGIFCESKAYREQWMKFSEKSDDVKLKWIEMIGKKLGFH